jgi:hypothetical protein
MIDTKYEYVCDLFIFLLFKVNIQKVIEFINYWVGEDDFHCH